RRASRPRGRATSPSPTHSSSRPSSPSSRSRETSWPSERTPGPGSSPRAAAPRPRASSRSASRRNWRSPKQSPGAPSARRASRPSCSARPRGVASSASRPARAGSSSRPASRGSPPIPPRSPGADARASHSPGSRRRARRALQLLAGAERVLEALLELGGQLVGSHGLNRGYPPPVAPSMGWHPSARQVSGISRFCGECRVVGGACSVLSGRRGRRHPSRFLDRPQVQPARFSWPGTSAPADPGAARRRLILTVTAVQRNEIVPSGTEAPGAAPREFPVAAILGELLRTFARAESAADLVTEASDVLRRGLGCEGALLRVREGESLRAFAGVGLGVDPASIPPVPANLQPWPAVPGPLLLERDSVACLLPAVAAGWPTVHFLPLVNSRDFRAVLYLGSRGPALSEGETDVLRAVGDALGPELERRLESERLRAGIAAREDALAVVAHDLRNPLHAVTVGVGMLLPRITEPALRRPVERIQRSAQRMERLLQDLLDIHAIEGGRFTLSPGEGAATPLIPTALESQQSLAGQPSVIINTDVDPALPAIGADEERVLQVLENLVGNALKFTPPGGVVTVGASRAEDPSWVVFSVRDTGPGIGEE